MEYTELSKKSVADLHVLLAQKQAEMQKLRFSFGAKDDKQKLALKVQISRIKTALAKQTA